MDVIASEPQNGDDNLNNSAQIFPCEDACKALTSHVTDADYEVSKNADECNQARNEILITSSAETSPETDSLKLNKINPNDLHPTSNQKTDVISEKVVPGSRSKKASQLPISSRRKIISTTAAHNAAWLDKRKFRAVSSSGGSEQSAHPVAPTSRPKSSRFPKVSVRPRASTVASAGGGPTVGPLPTTLPPIVTPDRIAGVGHWGRSRIPVRARSVDCRPERQTSLQSGRLSTRSSSCGSDGTRQAARRSHQSSARSGSCSPDSVHQAARRSVMRSARSSSYDSETRHQTARRSGLRATRPSSCGSADDRQRALRPPETASNWSLIDVNDNNRLLFGGQTTAVLDHEYDAKRKTDLIVIEHKQDNQEDPPSLPRVLRLKQHWENESGSSSARDAGAFPTGPRQGAAASLSPTSPGCSAMASGAQRKPGDARAPGPTATRSAARSGPSGQRAGQRAPGACHTPPRELVTGRTPGSAAPGSATPGATTASPKATGASRRPPVTYRPNLTPYPRQYILLGLLGPDPDQIKHRQDKMRRQREYVERQSHQNRVAARRREVVPVRVCSAEPRRRGQSVSPRRREQSASPQRREQSASPRRREWSASPQRQERQPLQTTIAGSASEEDVMGADVDFMHPVPACLPNQITTATDERSASSSDQQLTSAKDDGEAHPQNEPNATERDNDGEAPAQSGVKVASSTSVSDCASEYSLDWGHEETQLGRRESSVLSLDGGELMEMEMTAIPSKIMTDFDSVEESAAVRAQEPAVEESPAGKPHGPEEEEHVAEKPEQEEKEEMQDSDEVTTVDTVKPETLPLESEVTGVKEEIPSCEINLEHHYQETLKNEAETDEVVNDGAVASVTNLEIESNTPEPMSTVSLISESVSVKSEQTEEWPDWIRTCDQVNESWLEVAEDLAINELLNGLPQASGDMDATPTSHQSHEYSSVSPDHASESESEYDEFLSEAKSDISSDSDTEMVDALEELPTTPLRPELTDTPPSSGEDLPLPSPLTPSPPPPYSEQASTTPPPTPPPPTDIYPSSQVASLPPTLSPPLALQTPSPPIPVPLPEQRLVPLSVGLLYGDGFHWEGGAGGGCVGQSARRCSSDDLFLELPEQMAVSVTAGRCRGASGGCSCGPTTRPLRRTPAVDRSTQAPRQPASFVYKNLLVMDLTEDAASERSEGSGEAVSGAGTASLTESGTAEAEAGAEAPAGSSPTLTSVPVPVPVQGPFRRRRWDSRLWPSMLPDQPAVHRSWEETNWPDID